MRGVETRIQEIRHRIFREVARMAYHTEWPVDKRIEALPYKIIPGEVGNFRNDVFLERAIVGSGFGWRWAFPAGARRNMPLCRTTSRRRISLRPTIRPRVINDDQIAIAQRVRKSACW